MGDQRPPLSGCGIALGLFLIALGGLFLAARYVDIGIWDWIAAIPWDWAWVGFILVPGAVMLLFGLFGTAESAGLTIPGSIVTTLGLILAAQALTGAWASWSYAWTLIPASVGLGLLLFGIRTDNDVVRRVGSVMLAVALVGFVGFALLFEVVIGVGGFLGEAARAAVFPTLIIIAGILIVVSSTRRKAPEAPGGDGDSAAAPTDVTTQAPPGPPRSD